MEPQNELEPFLEKFADINAHESARWPTSMVSHLAKFKRPNLAIVAVVAIVTVDAYKSLPTSIVLAAIAAVAVIGVVGGFGND